MDGQITHAILEAAAASLGESVVIPERRMFADFTADSDAAVQDGTASVVTVSGQFDALALADDTLTDWKNTSVWAIKDDPKPEWTRQLNMLALLCARNDVDVRGLEIVARLRDWSKPKAAREPDYPQRQTVVLPVEMWSLLDADTYIRERITVHANAAGSVECAPDARWDKPTTWAVMKTGRKSALRVLNSVDDAECWMQVHAARGGDEIVERPGESTRCLHYCSVAQWCAHGRKCNGWTEEDA